MGNIYTFNTTVLKIEFEIELLCWTVYLKYTGTC